MGIIDTSVASPTKEDLQAKVKGQVTSLVKNLFTNMQTTYNRCMMAIWNNPNLSPQEALDAFGPDAADLFRLAGLLRATVNEAVPNTIPDNADIPEVTVNQDGTVTINVTPATPTTT